MIEHRVQIRFCSFGCLIFILLASLSMSTAAQTFRVVSLESLGCTSGVFAMNVNRTGFDGNQYNVRTQVLIDGTHYMNERATIISSGGTQWALFDTFSYGVIPSPGVWPMPSHQTLYIRITLERPIGWPLDDWLTIVRSCNLGGIEYNGPTSNFVFLGNFQ